MLFVYKYSYMKNLLYLIFLIFILTSNPVNVAGKDFFIAALEKRADGIYFSDHKMDADPETFQQLDVFWSKDKNKVFYRWHVVDVADPGSFEAINYQIGKDKYNVYWNSQFSEGIHAIKDADPKTFVLCGPTSVYAYDKERVFYISSETADGQEIKGTDKESFEILRGSYSKDKNNVYYKNEIVESADPDSFKVIQGSVTDFTNYSIDSHYVYCHGKKLDNSDAKTFEIINQYNAKDKNNVYTNNLFECNIMTGADPGSYVDLSRNYKKDKNNVYFGYWGDIIENADPESLELIQDIYSKDKNNVYLMADVIEGADPKTFRYLNYGYSLDANNVFYMDKAIKGADINSFRVVKEKYAADSFANYFQDIVISRNGKTHDIKNKIMHDRLRGRILLETEKNGEAWYVSPDLNKAYYLGLPLDAFAVMRELGLGISETNYNSFKGYAPQKLSGKIILRTEAMGEAYYVNPPDLKMHYLGRPADAFRVMRELGLGISSEDFDNL